MISPSVPLQIEKLVSLLRISIAVAILTVVGCVNKNNDTGGSTSGPVTIVRQYQESAEMARFDQLLESYGQNKALPEGFELQALLALSHYPALKDVKINFIIDDVGIPISSRPHWASMARSASNRTYQVIIDSQREGGRGALLLKNQPFNAQVGIIGHELAHSVYYLDRSFLGILGDAICQFSSCRIQFERATDRRLIDHGLGWQRFDHSSFVRGRQYGNIGVDSSDALPPPEVSSGAYMSPYEILQIMSAHPSYELPSTTLTSD